MTSVSFHPGKHAVKVKGGSSLMEAARLAGLELQGLCGGRGSCGKCRVLVLEGKVSEPDAEERKSLSPGELRRGLRLACRTRVSGKRVEALIPPQSLLERQRIQLESELNPFKPRPPVRLVRIKVEPAGPGDARSDLSRLEETLLSSRGLKVKSFDAAAARSLGETLSSEATELEVALRGDRLVAVGEPRPRRGLLGMAVDLGTSKIAVFLVDLLSGKTLDACGIMNSQLAMGDDVITRISYALEKEDGALRLQEAARDAVNRGIFTLCKNNGLEPRDILELCVVGNTAMHHLFLGLPVRRLALSPFSPVISEQLEVEARELGMEAHPGARVFFPPPLAGYVGSDHLAAILASRMGRRGGICLLADLGTNTELALKTPGGITCCSCASGPAFEGGCLEWGMRAAPGAVEHVALGERGELEVSTIDGAAPAGLCGSGALSALASLLGAGTVDAGGRMSAAGVRVRKKDGEPLFRIARRGAAQDGRGRWITLSQKDVRELQKAKGAVRAGVEMLLERAGVRAEDIDLLLLAGAFGSYLDVPSVLEIAMLPPLPPRRILQVGNAAGAGAREMLCSTAARRRASRLAAGIDYLELATYPNHEMFFAAGMMLGEEAVRGFMEKWRGLKRGGGKRHQGA
jgi:uncharacterized 2Fe-2S/4Fe-4S cluster protein (DUF4445 family)